LSQVRVSLAVITLGKRNALFFQQTSETIVDVFDSWSGMWNTSTLSQPRAYLAITSLGNLAFFGGGYTGKQASNFIDIFNSTSQTWSTSTLSQARYGLAASSIGEIVAFGGGWNGSTSSSVVDMFDVTSNTWFTVTLSQPHYFLPSTSSTNKIFFGGGILSHIVDIFDFNSSSQSPSTIPQSQQIPSPSSTTTQFTPTSNYSTTTMGPIETLSNLLNDTTGKMKFNHESCCFETQI
jgi:hypothetical protein